MGKYLVPIIIVGLLVLYVLVYLLGLFNILPFTLSQGLTIVVVIVGAVAFATALIIVLLQRIKEIKEEDKDDLSKY